MNEMMIKSVENAIAIEGERFVENWCEEEHCTDTDRVTFIFKEAEKPVKGSDLAWFFFHGGAEILKGMGYEPCFSERPKFNDDTEYIILVDTDDNYTFHKWEDYKKWDGITSKIPA